MLHRFLAGILALLVFTTLVSAEDWPAWRGPRLDGTSTEKNIPIHWSGTDNVAWKTTIPGIGHSSPIISGNRVSSIRANDGGTGENGNGINIFRADGVTVIDSSRLRIDFKSLQPSPDRDPSQCGGE